MDPGRASACTMSMTESHTRRTHARRTHARERRNVRGAAPWVRLVSLSRRVPLMLAALAAVCLPAAAHAQLGGPGFAFRQPTLSFAVHGGYALPMARSDLFDQLLDDLELARHDFEAPYLGGEIAARVSGRWDVTLEVGHAWSSTRTEWSDYIEDDGRPIRQTVEFARTPVLVSGRYSVVDRGRTIGRFVWVPAKVVPFVSGGLGVMRYRFAQDGDFVEAQTLEIFTDRLEQVGSAFTAQGTVGLDVQLNNAVYLGAQTRYVWGRGGLDRSVYDGFEPMDLSGFQLTLGLGARF